jgi:pre-mRNA cleavage complex 2 protein Pcf11
MPTPDEEEEVASSYADELADLTFNSKPIINSLTMIADESAAFSRTIADVILRRIAAAPADQKLPVIYLLDSISKNVRREYLAHFAARLPETMGGAFAASGPKVQASLHKLLKTWTGIFSDEVLTRVAERFATAGPAPVAAANGTAAPAPSPASGAATRKRTRADGSDGMRLELKGLTARVRWQINTDRASVSTNKRLTARV